MFDLLESLFEIHENCKDKISGSGFVLLSRVTVRHYRLSAFHERLIKVRQEIRSVEMVGRDFPSVNLASSEGSTPDFMIIDASAAFAAGVGVD